jgi:hypothetical protein
MHRAWWLVLGLAGLAAGGWFLVRASQAPHDHGRAGEAVPAASERMASPARRPALPATAKRTGPRYTAFDCTQPIGEAARVDGESLSIADLCARLARLGAITPNGTERVQAAHVLDRMIDNLLVRRALERERLTVTKAELDAALGAMGPRIGADVDLLTLQVRERLEVAKLVAKRADVAVSDREVEAELAAGAPGISRGQGMRVEGWIARTSPSADKATQEAARRRAESFAKALRTTEPIDAALMHDVTALAPFVVGESGVEPELEGAASALPAGRWSAALRTRVGYVVIRVVGIEKGEPLDAPGMRARVRKALETRKQQGAQQRLLEELRAAARIEKLVDV